MSIIISPTGLGLRMDGAGSGHYGAPRGKRLHNGHDYVCKKGQTVVSPITGRISRIARPYADDATYVGAEIVGERLTVVLFYMQVSAELIGKRVRQGDAIGIAQGISEKYGPPMQDHVHLKVSQCDPTLLM